jgi:EmrB/QacA subfamily drug resistance transporter
MSNNATQSSTVAAEREPAATRTTGLVMAILLSAIFMAQFDFFVVNVAAPALRQDLHAGDGSLELVVGGYAFAYAGGLVTGGRLGDMFGYRRMFIVGMLAFALTSLLCGLALNPVELVIARLLQGLAAAAMLPQVLASVKASFPASYQPKAMAWYGVTAGLGAVGGQVLGGLLVSSDIAGLSWRPIFLVNVPIGLVMAALAGKILPSAPAGRQRTSLDPLGATGIALAVALMLVPLSLGRTEGWPSWVWYAMGSAVPVALLTLWWQRELKRRGSSPTLDVTLFAHRSYGAGLIANVAFMLYFGSYMFTLSLLLQAGLGLSPLAAGLVFTPAALGFSLTAFAGRPLIARYGLRIVVLGGMVTVLGLALLAVRLHTAGLHSGLPAIVAITTVISLGNGIVLPSLIGAALIDVEPFQAGAAAGMLTASQQFASSAGVALIGTVFFAAVGSQYDRAGYPDGMVWAAVIDAILALLTALLVRTLKKSKQSTARS